MVRSTPGPGLAASMARFSRHLSRRAPPAPSPAPPPAPPTAKPNCCPSSPAVAETLFKGCETMLMLGPRSNLSVDNLKASGPDQGHTHRTMGAPPSSGARFWRGWF